MVWPTAAGAANGVDVTAATSPRASAPYEQFNFVTTRANATCYGAVNNAGTQFYLYCLLMQGGNLYRHSTYQPNNKPPVPTFKRVGSRWSSFKSIATSNYSVAQPRQTDLYGLNTNGSLYRYQIVVGGFRSLGALPGFRGFKAMTVISETAMYDTLLMNITAGALHTAHIPIVAGARPVLKKIRSTGWAAYESLVVQGCGTRNGSLIAAVDHDTKAEYQRAMSKANGAATAITSYGKIPAVFDEVNHVSLASH